MNLLTSLSFDGIKNAFIDHRVQLLNPKEQELDHNVQEVISKVNYLLKDSPFECNIYVEEGNSHSPDDEVHVFLKYKDEKKRDAKKEELITLEIKKAVREIIQNQNKIGDLKAKIEAKIKSRIGLTTRIKALEEQNEELKAKEKDITSLILPLQKKRGPRNTKGKLTPEQNQKLRELFDRRNRINSQKQENDRNIRTCCSELNERDKELDILLSKFSRFQEEDKESI